LSTSAAATPESAANPDSARGATTQPATLMVQSVRMLAASCSPTTTP